MILQDWKNIPVQLVILENPILRVKFVEGYPHEAGKAGMFHTIPLCKASHDIIYTHIIITQGVVRMKNCTLVLLLLLTTPGPITHPSRSCNLPLSLTKPVRLRQQVGGCKVFLGCLEERSGTSELLLNMQWFYCQLMHHLLSPFIDII